MKLLLLLTLFFCSTHACENAPENFVCLQSQDQFNAVIKKPALLLYVHNRSWKLDYASNPYFNKDLHEQVIQRFKELAHATQEITFAELEWTAIDAENKLSMKWVQEHGVDLVDSPFFLFYASGQIKRQLVPGVSREWKDDIKAKRMFSWTEADTQHIRLTDGTIREELKLFVLTHTYVDPYKHLLPHND